jgi:chemotaxis protein CheY-P-specific phosphatase CheC
MLIPTENLCTVLMFIPYDTALKFIDMFTKSKLGTTKEIAYREYVVLTELGTICLCGYLNALSKLLDSQYIPTPPAVACDAVDSILEESGYFLFIPDNESKEAIFRFFKVKNSK